MTIFSPLFTRGEAAQAWGTLALYLIALVVAYLAVWACFVLGE